MGTGLINSDEFDRVIKTKSSFFSLNLKEIWEYKDLLILFVKRDIITIYKQTILGPIWFFIQPLITALTYIFVFNGIAGLSTDGLPPALFYLAGITIWSYFSECFVQTSDTFTQNVNIFGKVYFPRVIIPLSKVISGLIKFAIQSILFLGFFLYYLFNTDVLEPNILILITPFLLILVAGLGLGFGLIFSSLTTKYRDLKFLMQFGIQLTMYASPIIYPLSEVKGKFRDLMEWNPFAHIIEAFKYIFTGQGSFSINGLIYSGLFMLIILIMGLLVFNKTEKNFMDTV